MRQCAVYTRICRIDSDMAAGVDMDMAVDTDVHIDMNGGVRGMHLGVRAGQGLGWDHLPEDFTTA